MSSRLSAPADAPSRWLIPVLAGILASGGLAAWAVGEAVGARELGAVLGTIVGGFVAGAALGRYREVVLASVVSAAPLVLIALFVVTWGIGFELARAVILVAAAVQAFGVLVGSAFGIAASWHLGIGPVRSGAAIALLALGACAVATGWLWFASTLLRPS
jgi:hypothetical protein